MAGFDKSILDGVGVMAAIVDAKSFAAAGDALDMTQSGVSRAVGRLEARLGVRVFDRTTRSVRLTDEGRRFHEQVMPLLGALQDATASASRGAASIRGRLRINVDPYYARLVLVPRLGELLDAHPELSVELHARDELGDLIGDGFDLAVRFGHPRRSTLVARKLLDTRILTVAAPSYLERHGRPREPRELAEGGGHVCIQFRDATTGRPFPWEFHRARRRIVMDTPGRLTVNDAGALYAAVNAGLGIAQVMALGSETLLAAGRLVELFPAWSDERFPLYAYHPSRHHVPAKTRAALDFIVALVR